MNWKSVSSSDISEVAYDDIELTLYIRFRKGGTYAYSNVPKSIYDGLMSASSHGRYLNTYVKQAGYSYKKI